MPKKNEIYVKNLTVRYQGQLALKNISLTIKAGKITGIIGPNGAGKSTFLKGLLSLVPSGAEIIKVGAKNLKDEKKRIAYVEQRSLLDLSFPINVLEVVLLGTYPKLGLLKRPSKEDKKLALKALETVQLADFKKRQIGELSGGQLQRVFIARVLTQDADIIILDEPFVGIDMTSEKVITDILKQLRDSGKTIIIVHHDLHKVSDYFDELIILNKTLIANGPVSTTFTNKNIQEAYGDSMGDILIKGVTDA